MMPYHKKKQKSSVTPNPNQSGAFGLVQADEMEGCKILNKSKSSRFTGCVYLTEKSLWCQTILDEF